MKNNTKRLKISNKNAEKIKYLKINKTRIYQIFRKIKFKNLTYVERKNMPYTKKLKEISFIIQNKVNSNKTSYRSINFEPIIETVATSYAYAILVEENINIFSKFKELTAIVKVYKKEAEILNILLIEKLLSLYAILNLDIKKIKGNVKKGKKIKRIKNNCKLSPATIYGAYLFNSRSTKLFYNKKNIIISSTNKTLFELDEIERKQRILYNYIILLFNGVK